MNTKPSHTLPWTFRGDHNISDAQEFLVATVHGHDREEIGVAIVRAVNAHDDLLVALERLVELCSAGEGADERGQDQARAAIAKARGDWQAEARAKAARMEAEHHEARCKILARIESERPLDGVSLPTISTLELAAYRMPDGSRFATLIDDREEIWESYAKEMAAKLPTTCHVVSASSAARNARLDAERVERCQKYLATRRSGQENDSDETCAG